MNPSLGYKRLLVWGEQGMGEQILFSSILRDLNDKFQSVLLMVDERLCKIFQEAYPHITVLSKKKIDENLFDYHLSLGSLPAYFRTNINDFSNHQILNLQKKDLRFDNPNPKTKMCYIMDKRQSLRWEGKINSLESLKDILLNPHIDFYDIQYTNEDLEIKKFNDDHGVSINKLKI